MAPLTTYRDYAIQQARECFARARNFRLTGFRWAGEAAFRNGQFWSRTAFELTKGKSHENPDVQDLPQRD